MAENGGDDGAETQEEPSKDEGGYVRTDYTDVVDDASKYAEDAIRKLSVMSELNLFSEASRSQQKALEGAAQAIEIQENLSEVLEAGLTATASSTVFQREHSMTYIAQRPNSTRFNYRQNSNTRESPPGLPLTRERISLKYRLSVLMNQILRTSLTRRLSAILLSWSTTRSASRTSGVGLSNSQIQCRGLLSVQCSS